MPMSQPEPSDEAVRAELLALRQRVAELEQQLARAPQPDQAAAPPAMPAAWSSDQRFQMVLESINVAVLLHRTGTFIYANPTAQQVLGYSNAELQQMSFADIVHPDYLALVQQRAMARYRGEPDIPARYSIQIVRRDGEARWVDISSTVFELDGQPVIAVAGTDISEHQRIIDELQTAQERFQVLVENITAAIFIHHQGRFRYVNPAAAELTGYTQDELYRATFDDLIHPDSLEVVRQRAAARQRGEAVPARYEITFVTKTGEVRWANINNSRIIYDGEQAIIVTAIDITSLRASEAERSRLQQEIIAAQAAALRELSTPLIPISSSVVVMPLVGQIDEARASQVLETLLEGIARLQATTAILDITGVPEVNSATALALVQAARAVRLLGARVMLTGIRPEVAQRLVALQIELEQIVTLGTLQAGIAYATGIGEYQEL